MGQRLTGAYQRKSKEQNIAFINTDRKMHVKATFDSLRTLPDGHVHFVPEAEQSYEPLAIRMMAGVNIKLLMLAF
ncbi:hypothetical protein XB02_17910 [Pantoea ananatis]|nr:hypothetical protein XB02_17910 [Pantoea ananatis]